MDLGQVFSDIITGFFRSLIEQVIGVIDGFLTNILSSMLWIENSMQSIMSASSIEQVRTAIYGFGVSLMILKLLKKGFMIYILWRDGDADNSPRDMVTGFGAAVFIMTAFPMLYDKAANTALWFSEQLRNGFALSDTAVFTSVTEGLATLGIFQLIVILIYFLIALVLFVQLYRRGIELLILRLGVPIAAIGLLDSDSGIFRPYIQQLFKTLFTSAIQITLFSMSFRLIIALNPINLLCSIALVSASFHTPALLQSFLVNAGGGFANKVTGTTRVVQSVRTILRK